MGLFTGKGHLGWEKEDAALNDEAGHWFGPSEMFHLTPPWLFPEPALFLLNNAGETFL